MQRRGAQAVRLCMKVLSENQSSWFRYGDHGAESSPAGSIKHISIQELINIRLSLLVLFRPWRAYIHIYLYVYIYVIHIYSRSQADRTQTHAPAKPSGVDPPEFPRSKPYTDGGDHTVYTDT